MGDLVTTPREIAEKEITAGILTQVATDDCGCPTYRVAEGRVSDFIGQLDLLTVGRKECTLPQHNVLYL